MSDDWFNAGYIRNKKTGRWHAAIQLDDEVIISDQSFATREEVLAGLKEWAESIGGRCRPRQ
jgi:hypothetical protein